MASGRSQRIVTWDYREQPDWDRIQRAMHEVFDGSHHPSLTPIEDTGSDQYALLITSAPITQREAESYFKEHEFDDV